MLPLVASRLDELKALCRRLRVSRLDLFGSAVSGGFDPRSSDLDFLVEFEEMAPKDFADAYFALKDALETMLGRPADLVTASSIRNPYFKQSLDANRENLFAA